MAKDIVGDAIEGRFRAVHELPVWKTIKIGTGCCQTVNSLHDALRAGGYKIGDWRTTDIFEKSAFKVAVEETEVDLVKITVAEFGFKSGASREQIYEHAKKLGLEVCSAEVGPQLRLQYKSQSKGEWLRIGMEPIFNIDTPGVFCVMRDDSGLWLWSSWGSPNLFCRPNEQWVFCRPRRK